MPILPVALTLLFLFLPHGAAHAAWTPAQPISRPADDASDPVVGAAGHVVYRHGRRVVVVGPGGGRRVLGRTRRPYEEAGVDARGNVIVLYTVRIRRPDGRGTTRAVESQRVSRSGHVSRPRRLARFAFDPTLAVDARGRVVAAWVRDLPANRFAVAAAGGTTRRGLERTGRVSRAGGRALRPRAAIGPRGLAMVAFAKGGRLRVAVRPAGRDFRRAADIGPASAFGQPNVALAVGRRGDAVVAWGLRVHGSEVFDDPGASGSALYAAVRRGGRWGSAQQLEGALPIRTDGPDAAMAPDGSALVGWVTTPGYEEPATPRVAVASTGDFAFGRAEDLEPPADVRAMRVGATGDGALHASWVNELSVQVASRPVGSAWGTPAAVHESGAHSLVQRGGRLAFVSPAGVESSRYRP